MAGRKSTKPAAKAVKAAEVEAMDTKTEEIKAEEKVAEPKATEAKDVEVKAAGTKKAAVKKTAVKTETAKKETVKKAPAKTVTKKVEQKCEMHIQYAGKSYSQEDLVKVAKDVWKYDLKRKVGELSEVELYVKPEENKVYYVMNGEFTGSFDI